MESDAIRIGLDLDYFWRLNPKQWAKYVEIYNEKEKNRVKEIDMLNYMLGKYIGWAVNDPKHYPKKAFLDEGMELKPMSNEEMEKQARRNTIKMGGEIK